MAKEKPPIYNPKLEYEDVEDSGTVSPEEAPTYDPSKEYEDVDSLGEDTQSPSFSSEALRKVQETTNILDIPRAAVESYLQEGKEGIAEFGKKMITEGGKGDFGFVSEAPTGKQVMAEQYGLSEEETLGPAWFKFSPAGAAGIAREMVTDPATYLNPLGRALGKPIQKQLAKRGGKQSSKAVSKWISKSQYKNLGYDPDVIGHQLYQEDVLKHIGNPRKLYEKLGSEETLSPIMEGGQVAYKKVRKGTGLIGKTSKDLTEFMDKMAEELGETTVAPKKILAYRTSSKILEPMLTEGTGKGFDPKLMETIMDQVNSIVLKGDKEGVMTVSDLLDFKRNVGKTINDPQFYKTASDAQSLKNEVLVNLERSIDDMIGEALDGVSTTWKGQKIGNAANYYKVNNTKNSALIKLKNVLDSAPLDQAKSEDLMQFITGGAVWAGGGAGMGAMMGHMPYGALVGGGFHALRSAADYTKGKTPEMLAKGFKAAEEATPMMLRGVPQVQRSFIKPVGNERSPDSIPEALMEVQLPRTTEGVMAKPDLFLAKLAQQTDSLDIVVQVQEAMKEPRKMEKLMPLLVRQFPNLFEFDEYNAWDGKIIDPADRQMYSKDIDKREDLNEYQKAEIIDHLNRTYEMLL